MVPRLRLRVAIQERRAVARPGLAVPAPGQAGVTDPGDGPAWVCRKVIAQHLQHPDEQVAARQDAGHAIELRLAFVLSIVGRDDGVGLLPVDQVVADALHGDAPPALPRGAGGVTGDEPQIALADRVPMDAVDVVIVRQHHAGRERCPHPPVGRGGDLQAAGVPPAQLEALPLVQEVWAFVDYAGAKLDPGGVRQHLVRTLPADAVIGLHVAEV